VAAWPCAIAHADDIVDVATHADEAVASRRGAAGGGISDVSRKRARLLRPSGHREASHHDD
jgi:hypothetical protein